VTITNTKINHVINNCQYEIQLSEDESRNRAKPHNFNDIIIMIILNWSFLLFSFFFVKILFVAERYLFLDLGYK
jgi:hypothetical protein